jgi:hypothetical protein
MKSVMSRSALGRRVAATAVLGLAATSLTLGLAGPANAVITIDVQGTVTGVAGAKLEGIHVEVYDGTTGDYIETTHTDVDGHYEFSDLTASSVKLWFDDEDFSYSDTTQYLARWNGGSKFQAGASAIPIALDDGHTFDMGLPVAAIIAGSVAAADGHELTNSWGTDVVDADSNWPDYDYATDGINFKIALETGTYRIGGYGSDTGQGYVESWWNGSDTLFGATPISATAGQTVSGINIRLSNTLAARKAPSVDGFAAVGRTLTADPGTWSRNAGTEFTYTWMRGATVVGTGATYTPTVADFGQRLNVVVRALNGDNAGQASSAATDPVKWASDAKGTAKRAGSHKVRFAMKIKSAKQSPVKGKVVVLRGAKKVHKPVKLVKGKVVITVAGQPKGKQTYTVLFKGNKNIAKSSKTFTVRVK